MAEYMITSEVGEVVLDPNDVSAYQIVNGSHGTDVEVPLTTSLYEFISFFLNGEYGV